MRSKGEEGLATTSAEHRTKEKQSPETIFAAGETAEKRRRKLWLG
jgi:hypothetical protein